MPLVSPHTGSSLRREEGAPGTTVHEERRSRQERTQCVRRECHTVRLATSTVLSQTPVDRPNFGGPKGDEFVRQHRGITATTTSER